MSGILGKTIVAGVAACWLYGCGDSESSTTPSPSPSGDSTTATTSGTTTSTTSPTGPSKVDAVDPLVRFVGRTRIGTGNKYVMMDWNSVHATVSFYGTGLEVEVSHKNSYMVAEVDGVYSDRLNVTSSKKHTFTLADNLPYGKHVATLWKVDESQQTEDADSSLRIYGFSLPDGGVFVPPPALRQRKLDIWGASMTAGYCADGPPGKDSQIYSNYNKTWAHQIALMLNAEHMTEAISGVGIAAGVDGTGVFKTFIDSSVMSPEKDWDWSNWEPNAVLIFLGTNDDHKVRVTEKFKREFANILEHAVEKYASSKPAIIHITEPEVCKDTQDDIDAFNQKHSSDGFKAYEVCFSQTAWHNLFSEKTKQYQGCDNHPNLAGGIMLAEDVLPKVREILGWSEFELV